MKKNIFKINYSLYTSKGVKPLNEDACWYGQNCSNQILAIVCDGIGSEKNSEIASSVVVQEFQNSFIKAKRILIPNIWFKKTLASTYEKLHALSIEKNIQVGTTLVLCLIIKNKAYIFNIGDSRLYHFSIEYHSWNQITKDHNLFNFLQKNKAPQIAYIKNKDSLLALTQYIDSSSKKCMLYDYEEVLLKSNDVIFLGTDGLYNYINIETINEIISVNRSNGFEKISEILVNKAIANYSNDNVTCIVVETITQD